MARAPPSHLTSIHLCMKLSLRDGEALRILCGQINIMEPESGSRLLNVPYFAFVPMSRRKQTEGLGANVDLCPRIHESSID